jgi:hypothetical protein
MDDAVRAAKDRGEVGMLDVCVDPGRLRHRQDGNAAGEPDDLVDCVICTKRAKHAGSGVSGCADHDDPRHG